MTTGDDPRCERSTWTVVRHAARSSELCWRRSASEITLSDRRERIPSFLASAHRHDSCRHHMGVRDQVADDLVILASAFPPLACARPAAKSRVASWHTARCTPRLSTESSVLPRLGSTPACEAELYTLLVAGFWSADR